MGYEFGMISTVVGMILTGLKLEYEIVTIIDLQFKFTYDNMIYELHFLTSEIWVIMMFKHLEQDWLFGV